MVLAIILIIAALGLAGWGFLNLTQATYGVGLIGLACFLAILARLAQADAHHNAQSKKLELQGTQFSMLIEQTKRDAPASSTPKRATPSTSKPPAPSTPKRAAPSTSKPQARGHNPKRCPHCLVFIPADASECPYCSTFVK